MENFKALITDQAATAAQFFALLTMLFFTIQFIYALCMNKKDAENIAKSVIEYDDE